MLGARQRRGTAIVVGGGSTALEIVEGLHAQGMHVHYFLRGDRWDLLILVAWAAAGLLAGWRLFQTSPAS